MYEISIFKGNNQESQKKFKTKMNNSNTEIEN